MGKEVKKKLELFAIPGIPFVEDGDNVAELILKACKKCSFGFQNQDVVVVAHKIVSRAEGRTMALSDIKPSQEAFKLGRITGKDPRHCQVILQESKRVLYVNGSAIITENAIGFVNTSSCVDRSNSGSKDGEIAVLLPRNPDQSAAIIRKGIKAGVGKNIAVIINDSFGRPWRKGSTGMAIGIAGIAAVHNMAKKDLSGRDSHPEIALVDQIASAASILMGESDEGLPVVVVRGAKYTPAANPKIQDLLRPPEEDQVWE